MKKHIWVFNHYAGHPSEGGGTRHYDIGKFLVNNGIDYTIISSRRAHPSGRIRDILYCNKSDVKWVLLYSSPVCSNSNLMRLLNMLTFSISALLLPFKKIQRPTTIIGSSVHPFVCISAYLLSIFYSCKFVFEVRDIWPLTLYEYGLIKKGPVYYVFILIEKFLFWAADNIVFTMDANCDYVKSKPKFFNKSIYIPNPSAIVPIYSNHPILNETFNICYLGTIGHANGIYTIIDSMRFLSNYNIKLKIYGDGPLKDECLNYIDLNNLKNIEIHPRVSKENISLVSRHVSIFVIVIPDKPRLYRFGVSPNKLVDYLMLGKPVLYISSSSSIFTKDNSGCIWVNSYEPNLIAKKIVDVYSQSDQFFYCKSNEARRFANTHFSIDRIGANYEKLTS